MSSTTKPSTSSEHGTVEYWQSKLPPIPVEGTGIIVRVIFEEIPGFADTEVERRFPGESTVWDVINWCQALGLKEDSFDIKWKGALRGKYRDWTLGFIDGRYEEGIIPFRVVPKQP